MILEMPTRTAGGRSLKNPAYVCTARDLWPTELDELTEDYRHDLDCYLRNFCRPVRNIADEVKCVACDAQLTARLQSTADKLGRTVEIDERTGEGRCIKCGYPLRAVHRMYGSDGRLLVSLVGLPLMYHPHATERK